jgi:hypothetical protein
MDEPRRVTTPDGDTGTVMQWPSGVSQHFRILRGNGEHVDYKTVTPVLLESGEVRFYDGGVLVSVTER